MGKNSNEKRARLLGMPHSTAANHLRKNIMFHLLIRLGENICFRCGNIIETVQELSVEHKEPWEDVSANLFWDLENIAFSHLRCNVPHNRSGPKGVAPALKLTDLELTARFNKIKHLDFNAWGFLNRAAEILGGTHAEIFRLRILWRKLGLM